MSEIGGRHFSGRRLHLEKRSGQADAKRRPEALSARASTRCEGFGALLPKREMRGAALAGRFPHRRSQVYGT